jgi:hypothetical protein
MTVSLESCRRFLLVGAALLVVVALVIATGVIPPVRADTFPLALPGRAAAAFWVNVVLCLVVAALLVLAAVRTEKRSRRSAVALGFLAAFVLLLALALFDAGSAFRAHGPALHGATVLLFLCAAADLLAGILVVASVSLFPRHR